MPDNDDLGLNLDLDSEETEETEEQDETESDDSEADEDGSDQDESDEDEAEQEELLNDREKEEAEENEDEEEVEEEEKVEDKSEPNLNQDLTVSNLTKAFPKIAQQFPELIPTLQKVEKYESAFESPEEAIQATKILENVNQFNNELMTGNVSAALTRMGKASPESMNLFVDNFLPTLFKADRETYSRITFPAVAEILTRIKNNAELNNNKNLTLAVQYVTKAITGDHNIPKYSMDIKKPQGQQEQTQQDPRGERLQKSFEDSTSFEVRSRVTRLLNKELEGKIPGNAFSRKMFVTKLQEAIHSQMNRDENWLAGLAKLHEAAGKQDFLPDESFKEKIYKHYTSKFQSLMPLGIRRLLKEMGQELKEGKKPVKKFINTNKKDDRGKNKTNNKSKITRPEDHLKKRTVQGDADFLAAKMGLN